MITVGKLKYLLEQVSDDAFVWAYEGEDTGFLIQNPSDVTELDSDNCKWIRATPPSYPLNLEKDIDTYTTGFDTENDFYG